MQNKCKTKKKHVEGQCLKDKKADFLSILFFIFITLTLLYHLCISRSILILKKSNKIKLNERKNQPCIPIALFLLLVNEDK